MSSKVQRQREEIRKAQEGPEMVLAKPQIYQEDPDEQEMENVFADFPQMELCIELYRVNVQGGRPAFLEQVAPVAFSQAYVAETYGGGRFLAKGKYKDGAQLKMVFEIEGEPILLKRKNPLAQPGVIPAPVFFQPQATGEGGEVGKDFQAMMMTMMNAMMAQMKGSENEFLEKMVKYKTLFGATEHREAPLETALNMFQKGVEMAAMNQGNEGGIPWMMVLKEMKEPLLKLVDTVNYALAPRKPVIAGKPAPVLPLDPSPGQSLHNVGAALDVVDRVVSEPAKEHDMIMMFVRSVLPALINGAARNADPANYVDFLLDQVPTGSYDSLRVWLLAPDCLDKLAAVEPGIRFQQDWWVSLRTGLLDALNEELGDAVRSLHPEPSSDPATGSPADHPILP